MKRFCALLVLLFLLVESVTGCKAPQQDPPRLTVACTTYPVFLLAQTLTDGVEGVAPVLVIDQQISCLHDYTLTMQDMKNIEAADLLAINGGGMEEFLEDVLKDRKVLDCSAGLKLDFHEDEGEYDGHIWLDPALYAAMAENLAQGLAQQDPAHEEDYLSHAKEAANRLESLGEQLRELLRPLNCRQLITFHDGFHYFAEAVGMEIAASVEEEEGSEASARRIVELTALIDQYHIPAVFTEVNGSASTAIALSYERGTKVAALTLGMSREDIPAELDGLDAYEWLMRHNAQTILDAYTETAAQQEGHYGEK